MAARSIGEDLLRDMIDTGERGEGGVHYVSGRRPEGRLTRLHLSAAQGASVERGVAGLENIRL